MAVATKNGKWIKRWEVPKSTGDGYWIVATDKDNNYGCSCPVWKFKRQECHHIKQVKMGFGTEQARQARPEYVLAAVNKPIFKADTNQLLCPLIALPDACLMEATICYYLLKYGYSIGEIREIRGHLPASWTARAIMAHVEHHGEAEYPEEWYDH